MQMNVISVESNFPIKKSKTKSDRKVKMKEETSSSFEVKLYTLIRTMERMVDKISITDK